ncbi:hypothetical protein Btru_073215 [Bulinus truncatus]|nr:hypothetical protein Btru_073215 [Bulinus truncatus]
MLPCRSLFQGYRYGSSVLRCVALRTLPHVKLMSTEQVAVKPFEEIPGPGGIYQWPVIGPLLNFRPFTKYTAETLHELLDHLQDRYGPVVRLRLSTQVVVVSEPKDIQTVYCNEGKYPIKPGLKLIAEFNKRNNITDDVALLQGEEWRAMRSILNKTFLKVDSASLYLEQQNGVADDFVNILETQKLSPEKFQDLLFRFASESIAVVTFNKKTWIAE